MKEAWCYILHPVQESPQRDVEWSWSRVPAQDGLLARASKKLVSEQGIWPELGPDNLNRQLERYIWNGKPHLSLKDLWEYLNRYIYLPRVKDRSVLSKTVQAAISGVISGPFALRGTLRREDRRICRLDGIRRLTRPRRNRQ